MLNFNPGGGDSNINNNNHFVCPISENGPDSQITGPSAYESSAYPLMGSNMNSLGHSANNSNQQRGSSPGMQHDRLFDANNNNNGQELIHQTPDSVFPFIVSPKGSDNVKRFSVNNLLQLAQCTNANTMHPARSMGELIDQHFNEKR